MSEASIAGRQGAGIARDLDIVVIGEINPDVVVRAADPRPVFGQVERWVDGIDLVIGSSSALFACGAARLGLRVAMAGIVGDDPLGRFMTASLAEKGLDTSAIRTHPSVATGATVLLAAPTDRAILTAPGTIPLLRVADVPSKLFERTHHVHTGSFFLLDAARPDLPDLYRSLRARGVTTSLDCNWDPKQAWDGGLKELVAETDVFLPNGAEATRITGQSDLEDAARALLGLGARVVAVKLGASGALAVTGGRPAVRCPALPVQPVDTTGAGDAFDAGFVAAWLAGRSLEASLSLGVACGSLSTLGIGGTATQPTRAEAEAAARVAGLPL